MNEKKATPTSSTLIQALRNENIDFVDHLDQLYNVKLLSPKDTLIEMIQEGKPKAVKWLLTHYQIPIDDKIIKEALYSSDLNIINLLPYKRYIYDLDEKELLHCFKNAIHKNKKDMFEWLLKYIPDAQFFFETHSVMIFSWAYSYDSVVSLLEWLKEKKISLNVINRVKDTDLVFWLEDRVKSASDLKDFYPLIINGKDFYLLERFLLEKHYFDYHPLILKRIEEEGTLEDKEISILIKEHGALAMVRAIRAIDLGHSQPQLMFEIIEWLLKNGADIHAKVTTKDFSTTPFKELKATLEIEDKKLIELIELWKSHRPSESLFTQVIKLSQDRKPQQDRDNKLDREKIKTRIIKLEHQVEKLDFFLINLKQLTKKQNEITFLKQIQKEYLGNMSLSLKECIHNAQKKRPELYSSIMEWSILGNETRELLLDILEDKPSVKPHGGISAEFKKS